MFKIKHFNDLNVNDMYEIAKSRYEIFACEQKITSENDFDDVDKECFHVFKEVDGKVVAYSRIIPKAYSSYEDVSIGRVLVLPSYRGQGLAKSMMKSCVDFIIYNLHEKHITLSAQTYIKSLYESIGFKEISPVYDEVGIPHVKMRL